MAIYREGADHWRFAGVVYFRAHLAVDILFPFGVMKSRMWNLIRFVLDHCSFLYL